MIHTYSIFSFLKNEHAYINQFIEYHLKLGFSYFYLIIDNLDINNIQEDYNLVIKEEFKSYVKLYDVRDGNGCDNHASLLEYFDRSILPEINEDWVLTLGCDSFLYLDGMKVDKYVEKVEKEHSEIFQILFPMYLLYNIYNNDCMNLFDLLGEKIITTQSYYMYSMGKVNNIKNISLSSHFYSSRTETNNIYFSNNSLFNKFNNKDLTIKDLLLKCFFDIFDDNHTKFFCFHFYLRYCDEIFIKDLLNWNSIKSKKKDIKNIIKNIRRIQNKETLKNKLGDRFSRSYMLMRLSYKLINTNKEFKLEKLKNNINIEYNEKRLEDLLLELKITREEYLTFKYKFINYVSII